MRTACVLLIVGLIALPAYSQDNADGVRSAILALDADWQLAIVDGDVDFIKRHTDPDFTFIHAGEQTAETKADWIRKASSAPREFTLRRVTKQLIEIHGRVAIVFGKLDVRTNSSNGSAVCYSLAYAHLYERQENLWLFFSHLTTRILEQERPCPDGPLTVSPSHE